ncbi:unnamed protein product [Echinostoma caproni]|uniref:ATPase AAA-type core domain-containing protein n=1 Tax=Echinostoma caproni TaxID=27848 RepID=A0A3P8EVI9_9TREM|nr:unnamed protein product [Echinostoma caproni]
MLVELDGIDKHRSGRVFVVGATNRKDMIDPAVLRPGRLGLHLMVNPPTSPSDRTSVLVACTKAATAPPVEGGMQVLCDLAADPRTDGMRLVTFSNRLCCSQTDWLCLDLSTALFYSSGKWNGP